MTGRSLSFFFLMMATCFFMSCISGKMHDTTKTQQTAIDLTKLTDGDHFGVYSDGKSAYKVNVNIKDHSITGITILENGSTAKAKKAERVIDEVMTAQKTDVDVISGATEESQALLKAVENALLQ